MACFFSGFMYILTFCGSGREGHNKRTCPLHIENPNDDLSHALGLSRDIFEDNTSAAWVRGGMNMHFNSDNDWDQLDHQVGCAICLSRKCFFFVFLDTIL